MKIEISYTQNRPEFLFVNDITALDILCSDGEAIEIIVDDVLCKYKYDNIPQILYKICNKLKSGGRICVYITDIGLLARDLSQEFISVEEFNSIISITGRHIESLLDTEYILKCLLENNIKIQTKQIKKYTSIIPGVLNERN